MAGTIFGLGLSQQHDINGEPMEGAKLYIYDGGTLTPADVFQNAGLVPGQEHAHPIVADATGRIPQFWMDEGSYRVRLTDADGVVQFDEDNILAIGPGTAPSVITTPDDQLMMTGDIKWRAGEEDLDQWLKLNGQTIGSPSSGATNASALNEALYLYLYANFTLPTTNAICVVASYTGVAATDWAANRAMTLLDMRGKAPFGLDDMGSSALGIFTGITFDIGNGTIGGSSGGDATHTLVAASVPPLPVTIPSGQGSHGHAGSTVAIQSQPTDINAGGVGTMLPNGSTSLTIASNTLPAMSGTANDGVTAAAHATISPFILGTWYIHR